MFKGTNLCTNKRTMEGKNNGRLYRGQHGSNMQCTALTIRPTLIYLSGALEMTLERASRKHGTRRLFREFVHHQKVVFKHYINNESTHMCMYRYIYLYTSI